MKSTLVLHIALPVPLYQSFEYLAAARQGVDDVNIGARARVPFGRRTLIGIVVEKTDSSRLPASKLKPVHAILDTQPVFNTHLMALLFWAARYYHQPPGEVFSAALPKVLRTGKFIAPVTKTIYRVCNHEVSGEVLRRAPKQRLIFELLLANADGLSGDEITRRVPDWRPAARALLSKKLVVKVPQDAAQPITTSGVASKEFSLNQEQYHAYNQIHQNLHKFDVYLLAGVTGSGKTEVYLALAKEVIVNRRQVLILVPEIGLTLQLVQRIQSASDARVAVMHSNLSDAERAQVWLAANTGSAQIVVGTRSAVFLPFKNLGLIVVDEEHDLSLKQQEGFLYHARDVAIYRAKQTSIPIILGSATPSFESQYNVNTGRYQKLVLSKRARRTKIPEVKLIDLRSKAVSDGLSNELLQAIEGELGQQQQVLLFLNRRGYAPTLLCRDCGWVAECSRCDVRMTFHKQQNIIRCHHCCRQQQAPDQCPLCQHKNILWLGEGTQRVENKLRQVFPNTAITRIDRDNTRKKNTLYTKLKDIHAGKYQIIIGTQMLSKGHDFPGVSLVGILNVDHGLFSTDFRATERLAQLIVQVAGRAGRATNTGKVLLQTYQPEHSLLNCLLAHGYEAFSREALKIRESCSLPPYTFMTLIRARAHRQEFTRRFLYDVKNFVETSPQWKFLGPIPAMQERKAGLYQSQLVVISSNRKILQQRLHDWIPAIQQLPLAKRVRWSVEVDPLEME